MLILNILYVPNEGGGFEGALRSKSSNSYDMYLLENLDLSAFSKTPPSLGTYSIFRMSIYTHTHTHTHTPVS